MATIEPTTAQPEPAWDEETRANLEPDDVCRFSDDYCCYQDTPWPYLASGPSLIIQSIFPNDAQDNGIEYGDPLGSVVITPYGPILRLESDICQGTMPAVSYQRAETVYGSREALTAIGAINIFEVPY